MYTLLLESMYPEIYIPKVLLPVLSELERVIGCSGTVISVTSLSTLLHWYDSDYRMMESISRECIQYKTPAGIYWVQRNGDWLSVTFKPVERVNGKGVISKNVGEVGKVAETLRYLTSGGL